MELRGASLCYHIAKRAVRTTAAGTLIAGVAMTVIGVALCGPSLSLILYYRKGAWRRVLAPVPVPEHEADVNV